MIALVLSSTWPNYYASSPFNNLLKSNHPSFKVFAVQPHQLEKDPDLQWQINGCEALVVDDVCIQATGFYKGLKLMIGGDPHAHTQAKVNQLEAEYASAHYVLTGAVFSKKLPQYFYPAETSRTKHVYFPPTVPDTLPDPISWGERMSQPLLCGSVSAPVYPFREACRRTGKFHQIPFHFMPVHNQYFETASLFKYAVTCNSIFEYTVAKYFEFPACGTILLAPRISSEEVELIGFRDQHNVFWCDTPDDVLNRVNQLELDESNGKSISTAGLDLMRSRHSVMARLNYLEKLIQAMKLPGFRPQDAFQLFLQESHV
jgi:hypothetical protein